MAASDDVSGGDAVGGDWELKVQTGVIEQQSEQLPADYAGVLDGETSTEFQINSYTTSAQSDPSVTSLSDGGFVVTWQSNGQDGAYYGIYGQRYDASSNTIALVIPNQIPTLTQFSEPVETTDEDTEVEIAFSELMATGNESDADGTVEGFVVKSVMSGTLRIGADAASATPYDEVTNKRIDGTNHAYWTPDENANGELGAFSVVAVDNDGAESNTPIEAKVNVMAVNDAPTVATAIADASTVEDALYSYNASVNFTDVDAGDVLSFTATQEDGSTLPGWLTIDESSGVLSGTPENGDANVLNVSVIATDHSGASVSDSYMLIVTNRAYNETSGDDNLYGSNGDDVIYGAAGDDWLTGGRGDDILVGGTGNDTMFGGTGADTYYVDSENDTVIESWFSFGQPGTDTVIASVDWTLGYGIENLELIGNKDLVGTGNFLDNLMIGNGGDSVLQGLFGDDVLEGSLGNDTLDGGWGNDVLTVGKGTDYLTGGWGRDVFRYTDESESGVIEEHMDTISDFEYRRDKIDLSGIDADTTETGDQAFSSDILNDTEAFTEAWQLRFDSSSGILYGNTDADTDAEFAIELLGVTSVEATAFIL